MAQSERVPEEGQRPTIALWIGLAILMTVIAITYLTRRAFADKNAWVEHTHEVIEHLLRQRAALTAAQSLSQAYSLTGEVSLRADYAVAIVDIKADGEAVRALTIDNPSQWRLLDKLEPLIRERIANYDVTIERKRPASLDLDDVSTGRVLDIQVSSTLADMVAEEGRLLIQRKQQADDAIERLVVMQHVTMFTSIAVLLFAFSRLRRESGWRFRSEQAAKQGEANLTRILMSIGDGVIATDLQGRVVRMNHVTEQLTGWTAAAGIGKHASEVFHVIDADTHKPIPDPIERVLHQWAPIGLERPWLLTRRDGSEVPVTDSCAAVRDEGGEIQGAVLVFRDVTEAQRAKTFFRALVEKSSDGITLAAPDGKLTYASPAAARILGCTAEAVVGTNVLDYADDIVAAREDNRSLVESTGASVATESCVKRQDGTRSWIEVTGTNMVDNPAVGAIVRNMRDVTEKKGTEGALRASEARFARLSESGLIGIALVDLHGNIRDANDACLRMLGYSRADLRSGKVRADAMTSPEWKSVDDRATEQLKINGVAAPWEKELLRQDGSRIPVLIGAAMLDDQDCISFVIDLTDRKRSERTLSETRDQLRQAQKMDAVGRLAGGVAHDFNNMLTVILTYSQLLLQSVKPSDPMHADLDEIRRAGQRAADLTRQLLMFSRQQVIEPRVIDLNDVLSNMESMLERLLGEDIDITLTKRSTAKVLVDPSGIEQVVMNLVVNARDAMPQGGKLTIETADVVLDEEYAHHHVGVSPGAHVMLAVTDAGSGMDAATCERIFEPFFTTKGQGKGTGLGLSIVFGIATQSGGSVWVYSELGLGTTFKVYFPRSNAQSSGEHMLAVAPITLRGTETILLVEDEEQVRAAAHGILTRSGYKVISARTAGEALLAAEQHTGAIQLLLSDVVMPQMSGPELARRLAVSRPEMRVLCMSGYTDDSIVRHGVLEARFAFLQKPITPDTLTRKVREVLEG